ncbi:MAG: radical SAM protein [Candidatus Anammoximicrobium sp.]|nr:radical SAM protein [Candidatus Anammoximicrobium sp.]
MTTDILIVNPPSPDGHVYIRDVCRWGRRSRERMIWPQTSLAYLAAMVPDGLTVRIIDAIAEQMTMDQFLAEVRREQPRFYVTYLIGSTFDSDARGVREAKQAGATTIAVGTHVSAVPKNTLQAVPELDFVIRHEPEYSFADILDRVLHGKSWDGVTGIGFRDQRGEIVITPDRPLVRKLDDLPIPKQHLLPLDKYRMPFLGKRYTWVLTNRGCPYSCTYCFEGVVWGKSVRYRSAESIFRELQYLAEHDVRNVLFLADLFTYDRAGVLRLCDLIIASGLRIRWTCNSRVDTIDEDMLVRMKQAGCWLIAFGIESGSQAVLDNVKKDARVADAEQAIRLCHRHGVKTWGYFIIGLPGETRQTVRETIDFAKRIPLDVALFHVAMPYAGTEFYFQAVANGWLNTSQWQHFDMNDSAVVQYADFGAADILRATKQAFREFYFRPVQMWRLARMMIGAGDLGMIWSVARNFLGWIWTSKQDRVAARPEAATSEFQPAVTDDDARNAVYSLPVVEAPRSNPQTAKPRHKAVQQAAATGSPPRPQ